jgi:hypothetical protein
MPKVYFLDTGLRNFFVNNFDTYDYRLDKWELLENIVFNRFLKNYNTDDIRFWRTQNKNEVDFVIEREKKAFEIKVDKSRFNEKKYKLFTETYNDFSLEVIDLEKSLFL